MYITFLQKEFEVKNMMSLNQNGELKELSEKEVLSIKLSLEGHLKNHEEILIRSNENEKMIVADRMKAITEFIDVM